MSFDARHSHTNKERISTFKKAWLGKDSVSSLMQAFGFQVPQGFCLSWFIEYQIKCVPFIQYACYQVKWLLMNPILHVFKHYGPSEGTAVCLIYCMIKCFFLLFFFSSDSIMTTSMILLSIYCDLLHLAGWACLCLMGKAQPLVDQCSHNNGRDAPKSRGMDLKGKSKRKKSCDPFLRAFKSAFQMDD